MPRNRGCLNVAVSGQAIQNMASGRCTYLFLFIRISLFESMEVCEKEQTFSDKQFRKAIVLVG